MPAERLGVSGMTPSPLDSLLDRVTLDVAVLPEASVRALAPVLEQARREVEQDLARWLAREDDPGAQFTAQRYRQVLLELRRSEGELHTRLRHATREPRAPRLPPWVESLSEAVAGSLTTGAETAADLAGEHVRAEYAAMAQHFGGDVGHMQLRAAEVLARNERTMVPLYMTSAQRYAYGVWDDLRNQLAIGLSRSETIYEMTSRLVQRGGPRGAVAAPGKMGNPVDMAAQIADGIFGGARYRAERLVRTEVINAYSESFLDEAKELAKDDPDLMLRWDSRRSPRTCSICIDLDGVTIPMDGIFPGGYKAPPAHCNCRCSITMHKKGWN
jgi:SPP1 gp7 family putative phage head morphogenesis protein